MIDALRSSSERSNRILLVAAGLLVLLSAFTYYDSVTRADRFERGQKFLPNLNPDEVAEIVLEKGDDRVHLRRTQDGDRFVVVSADGYRADNASVNRLLRDILDLSLEKEVGAPGDRLVEELELQTGDERPEGSMEVALLDKNENDMVRFVVGTSQDEGQGQYVRRVDGKGDKGADAPIYLTDKRVYLQTTADDYVDQEIVNVERDEIARIEGNGFVFARERSGGEPIEAPAEAEEAEGEPAADGEADAAEPAEPTVTPVTWGDLDLLDVPEGKKEGGKASSVKGVLSPLRFSAHHLADAEVVRGLRFDQSLRVTLKDGSGYILELATRRSEEGAGDDETHYLRVQGTHEAAGQQVYVDLDASEDEVRETSEQLMRANEVADFNDYHGSWIYEVTSTTADRIRVGRDDLLIDG